MNVNRKFLIISILLVTFVLSFSAIKVNIELPNILKNIIIVPQPSEFTVDLWLNKPDGSTYNIGEKVYMYVKPNKNCYIFIYEIRPTGEVKLIFPNYYDRNNYVRANTTFKIPSNTRYYLKVSGPTGKYYLQVIASLSKYPYLSSLENLAKRYKFPKLSDDPAQFRSKLYSKLSGVTWASDMTYFYVGTVPSTGVVRFRSTPSGAAIYLDGAYIGVTPKTLTVDAGTHVVTYIKSGYEPWSKTFTVYAGSSVTISATLRRVVTHGQVTFSSIPSGASLYVDGSYRGKTPKTLTLTQGYHTYRMTLTGYEPREGSFSLSAGEVKHISVNLVPLRASVTFTSNPDGASVYLDEAYIGNTPITVDVSPGTHSYRMEMANYLPVSGSFSISYGETKRIHEDLTPIPVKGKINITSDPPGAMVFINGVLIGITPVDAYEVDPGYYEVVIIKAGYKVSVKGVSVSAGETEVVNVVLTPIE